MVEKSIKNQVDAKMHPKYVYKCSLKRVSSKPSLLAQSGFVNAASAPRENHQKSTERTDFGLDGIGL
jgi:hypothetical protein